MNKHLNPVPMDDAVLRLSAKDFDALSDYIKYLGGGVDLFFYHYKDSPGLICQCKSGDTIVGTIQLKADGSKYDD